MNERYRYPIIIVVIVMLMEKDNLNFSKAVVQCLRKDRSFLLFVFANNLEEGTCSKLLHSHKPIITLECLHYLPVKSVTRNFIITTTVLDPFILIIYLYTDICFKNRKFPIISTKKNHQKNKSNF